MKNMLMLECYDIQQIVKLGKIFDQIHESFAMDPHNVRLGLARDGFKPFKNTSIKYSVWPIILFHIIFPLGYA